MKDFLEGRWQGPKPQKGKNPKCPNCGEKTGGLTHRHMKLEPYKRPQKRGGKKSTRRVKTARWIPA